ncbi:helix-turn-helix domain-containing protein [Chloroflexota bacterium]
MIVKTRIFEFSHNTYKNLSELAHAMDISVSQVYRVRQGKRSINQKFIVGAIKAFPECTFEELFYFAHEVPAVTNKHSHEGLTGYSLYEQLPEADREEKRALQTTGVK